MKDISGFSEKVVVVNCGNVDLQYGSIHISFDVTCQWDLQAVKTSVEHGIFLRRYCRWVTEKGFIHSGEEPVYVSFCVNNTTVFRHLQHTQTNKTDIVALTALPEKPERKQRDDWQTLDCPTSFSNKNAYNPPVICAIDLGTTYSGFAYAHSAHPDGIIINPEWGNQQGLPSMKTPTCVLTNATGEFDAFGYEAEYKYSEFCFRQDAEGIDLYRNFKMLLHNEKDITRATEVISLTGNRRPAFDIFSMVLSYMKSVFGSHYTKHNNGRVLGKSDVMWVITIPAIWSDKAKQFMREVAVQAGLITEVDSNQLMFALEPEAAAVYCQTLASDKWDERFTTENQDADFSTGTKYMVIDAGGGTVDITLQEVLPGGNIKEIYAPSGVEWGGDHINEEIEQIMISVFGNAFIQGYKKAQPVDWFNLMLLVERKKRAISPEGKPEISFPITMAFNSNHSKLTGNNIEDTVNKNQDIGVFLNNYEIVINQSKVCNMYHKLTKLIIPHIEKVLDSPQAEGLKQIFLVGGFAESDFLKKAITGAFFKQVVLIPKHSITAVLRGAVMFGLNPEKIASRIARKSYGFGITQLFVEREHPESKKIFDEYGKVYCNDIFWKIINKNDEIKVGDFKTFDFSPLYSDTLTVILSLYATENENAKFIDDEDVQKVGEITIEMLDTKGGRERKIESMVYFGGTEIKLQSKDIRPEAKSAKATINFLCDLKRHKIKVEK